MYKRKNSTVCKWWEKMSWKHAIDDWSHLIKYKIAHTTVVYRIKSRTIFQLNVFIIQENIEYERKSALLTPTPHQNKRNENRAEKQTVVNIGNDIFKGLSPLYWCMIDPRTHNTCHLMIYNNVLSENDRPFNAIFQYSNILISVSERYNSFVDCTFKYNVDSWCSM